MLITFYDNCADVKGNLSYHLSPRYLFISVTSYTEYDDVSFRHSTFSFITKWRTSAFYLRVSCYMCFAGATPDTHPVDSIFLNSIVYRFCVFNVKSISLLLYLLKIKATFFLIHHVYFYWTCSVYVDSNYCHHCKT